MYPHARVETADDAVTLRHRHAIGFAPHLFFVLHADTPATSSSRHSLAGIDRVVFARGPRSCQREGRTLHVRVPAEAMSATHAVMCKVAGSWLLDDAGSRNGTRVNGERVERTELTDGDLLEMGHAFFVFRASLETPAGSAQDLDATALAADPPGLRTMLPALAGSLAKLKRIARTAVPVLLLGPTGSGKEVLARAVHASSGRTGAFVAVNCGALPPALVEGMLFGHVRGAFSGAVRDEPGLVRAADGGTLLLDEIGDLPLASQVALLRVLQEGEVTPVGATRPIQVNVRVIAATHRPLAALAASQEFRADLLARLQGFVHHLPELAARREDLGLIMAELRLPALCPDVARAILQHTWPMNVRELQQCLTTGAALTVEGEMGVESLPAGPLAELAASPRAFERPSRPPTSLTAEDLQLRDVLAAHLTAAQGNVAAVARIMGKDRVQIHRWMRRLAIDPNAYRAT